MHFTGAGSSTYEMQTRDRADAGQGVVGEGLASAETEVEAATILVVDDEPLARQMFTDLLESQGFEVLAAADGDAAFPLLQHADLVLLDAMLPGRDGWSICREIKSEINPLLPVIMVTARTAPDDVVRTFEAGADDYVAKPFHVAELTARIGSRLRVHRSELALQRMNEQLTELADRNYLLYDQARQDAEQRELLLRELDHRVRNNLAVIMGLVGLERNRRPPRSAQQALSSLENRLRAFLLVHEAFRRRKYRGVPIREIAERIGQRLRGVMDRDGRIQLEVVGDVADLNERQGFGLALALNELISNALQHAFPDESRGLVRIAITEDEGEIRIEVADSGIGAPAESRPSVLGSGRSVVDAVMRGELGGSVERIAADEGTRMCLVFPRAD